MGASCILAVDDQADGQALRREQIAGEGGSEDAGGVVGEGGSGGGDGGGRTNAVRPTVDIRDCCLERKATMDDVSVDRAANATAFDPTDPNGCYT